MYWPTALLSRICPVVFCRPSFKKFLFYGLLFLSYIFMYFIMFYESVCVPAAEQISP